MQFALMMIRLVKRIGEGQFVSLFAVYDVYFLEEIETNLNALYTSECT